MTTSKFLIIFLFTLMFVRVAYAATEDAAINLDNLDDMLAEKLNISLFSAQLLASTLLLCLPLFPALMLAGYFGGQSAVAIVGLVVGLPILGFCVALGWLPVWIMVVIVIGVALMLAGKMRDFLSGGTI